MRKIAFPSEGHYAGPENCPWRAMRSVVHKINQSLRVAVCAFCKRGEGLLLVLGALAGGWSGRKLSTLLP